MKPSHDTLKQCERRFRILRAQGNPQHALRLLEKLERENVNALTLKMTPPAPVASLPRR